MCLAESRFCSNNILNTEFFLIKKKKKKKRSPNRKFSEKNLRHNWPKLQAQKSKPTKTETNRNRRFFNYFVWFQLRLLQTENFGFGWPDKKNRPNRKIT